MPELRVDFNRPVTVGNEFEYLRQAIENRHLSGDATCCFCRAGGSLGANVHEQGAQRY